MRFDAVIFDLYGTLVDNIDEPGPYQLSAYKFGPSWTMARVLDAPLPISTQRLWSDAHFA